MRCINLPDGPRDESEASRQQVYLVLWRVLYNSWLGLQSSPNAARGCQLQLLQLSWVELPLPDSAWLAAVCHCLSVLASSRNQLPPGHCQCVCVCECAGVRLKLMPSRIYITEPPFPCCVYCSCCDKCYRCCLSASLSLTLSLSLSAFSFTHQFNWKASSGLSLLYFVICLLAICHFLFFFFLHLLRPGFFLAF